MTDKIDWIKTKDVDDYNIKLDLGNPDRFFLGEYVVIKFEEIRQTLDEIHQIKSEIEEIKAILRGCGIRF